VAALKPQTEGERPKVLKFALDTLEDHQDAIEALEFYELGRAISPSGAPRETRLSLRFAINGSLSTRQRDVLRTAVRFFALNGEPCTTSQVARRLRLGRTTVRQHIASLLQKYPGLKSAPFMKRLKT
jgi:hypothetical protein